MVAQAMEEAVRIGDDAGVASVISELTEEDWLSSGSSSNKPRSTSVCSVGVGSTNCAGLAVTVMFVFASAMVSTMASETGTVESHVHVLRKVGEPLHGYRQVITVEGKIGEHERAVHRGFRYADVAAEGVCDADFGPGYDRFRRIGDCALYDPRIGLRMAGPRSRKNEEKRKREENRAKSYRSHESHEASSKSTRGGNTRSRVQSFRVMEGGYRTAEGSSVRWSLYRRDWRHKPEGLSSRGT